MNGIRLSKGLFVFVISACWLLSCSKGNNPEASSNIPNVSVNVSININTSPYTGLTKIGGEAYVSGGYRGIILYRKDANTIMAFDRTCSYDLSDANGIVQAQTNGTAICLECGSTYSLYSGAVNVGPSTIGLKVYNTTFNLASGAVTITN
ncbi:MAG TPA: hypothetical protein VK890_03955 [Bacteroidia bacterium]|jgi:hypothetical protein|nr:hypothetical protein [Bacteroidia bacterium]